MEGMESIRNKRYFVVNVLNVTRQQAFDTFISADRERLHSYANYFPVMIPEMRNIVDYIRRYQND